MKRIIIGFVVLVFVTNAEAFVRMTLTHTVASVGVSSAQALAANTSRRYLKLINDHATQVIYCKFGVTAVVNEGIRINAAGGVVTFEDLMPMTALNCIATGASTPLLISQGQ